MSKLPSVSIILPTLIRTNEQFCTTVKCIRLAREKTNIPFELIIVETETNFLEEYADKYIHIPNKTISTRDINLGFRAADTLYVGLLTNDVFVDDGWLEALIDCFTSRSDCGIATLASTQFNERQKPVIDFGIWCSVFLTKKELFEEVGYFDADNFPNVFDDTDFIMRLALSGYSSYKNHSVVVHHKIGMTHYINPKHQAQYDENRKRFNEKYKDCGHPLFDFLK